MLDCINPRVDVKDFRDFHEKQVPIVPTAGDARLEPFAETIDYTCLFMWRAR